MTERIVAVDFETYYTDQYSVKDLGVDAYCDHPEFDPYLVSVVSNDGVAFVGKPEDFPWESIQDATWGSHNARFDETVFLKKFGSSRGPKKWICTADLAVYNRADRSLAKASSALLGTKVSKAFRGKMKGHNYESLAKAGMLEGAKEYALNDSKLCLQLMEKFLPTWPEAEQQLSIWNRQWGRMGINVDRAKLESARQALKQQIWVAEQSIPWKWDDDKTPLSHRLVREQCRLEGIEAPSSLAMDSDICAAWEAKYGERYPFVAALRVWRRCNMLIKKLDVMHMRLRPDGTMGFGLKYFGGHTGRFSGDSGVNMQNLPRAELMGINLRSMFVPREGKVFVIVDLAQIEARILLHLADPRLYQFAKAAVLGLGYGCGATKFKVVAKNLAGLDITSTEAETAVRVYRRANPKITGLWAKLDRDFKWSRGHDYELVLPSGRSMPYYDVQPWKGSYAARNVKGGILNFYHGGKLVENLVQATARDVFVSSFPKLVEAGLAPLFHVHDEYVIEVDRASAEEALKKVCEIVCQPPDWLAGCPLDAEGAVADCYQK